MRAIVAGRPGGPDVLEWEEIVEPVPGPGELLVRVHAAGVNFIDTYKRSGVYPMEFPHIPGSEGAGVVVAVGGGVTEVREGDRVAWASAPGSYAELAVVPAAVAVPVPDGMDLALAAALPLQGFTAHYLVASTFPVGPETHLLITAGAGGVGSLVVQLAKDRGATVLTTVGSAEKARVARAAGADHVIVLSELSNLTEDLPTAVRDIVPGGLDVVYDGIGKDTFEASLAMLRPRGLLVLFGGASGQVPPFDLQRLNRLGALYVTRPSLSAYVATRDELEWRAAEVFGAVADGRLHVRIGSEFALGDAAAAHRALEARETTGKAILRA